MGCARLCWQGRARVHCLPPLRPHHRSYLPLEVLRGELGQLAKADMFALGASLLELATRAELPSGGQQYADLRMGKLPLLPTCTHQFASMIRCMGEFRLVTLVPMLALIPLRVHVASPMQGVDVARSGRAAKRREGVAVSVVANDYVLRLTVGSRTIITTITYETSKPGNIRAIASRAIGIIYCNAMPLTGAQPNPRHS